MTHQVGWGDCFWMTLRGCCHQLRVSLRTHHEAVQYAAYGFEMGNGPRHWWISCCWDLWVELGAVLSVF